MSTQPSPTPTYRVEWTGSIQVWHPVKPPWWAPHTSKDCDVFRAPHADCDCGAEITW